MRKHWFTAWKRNLAESTPQSVAPLSAEDRAAKRAALFDAWQSIQSALQPQLADTLGVLKGAAAKVAELERALLDARSAHFVAANDERAVRSQLDTAWSTTERALQDVVDPTIEALIDDIDASRPGLQLSRGEYSGEIDRSTGKRPRIVTTNLDAIQRVAAAMATARERALALRFDQVPDLDAALDEIRNSVPSVEECERAIEREQQTSAA